MMKLTGKVYHVSPVMNVTETFQKRELVVITDEDTPYPQHILFQLTRERMAFADSLNVGDMVEVDFNIRGKRYERDGQVSFFNTLDAWRINRYAASHGSGAMQPMPQQPLQQQGPGGHAMQQVYGTPPQQPQAPQGQQQQFPGMQPPQGPYSSNDGLPF